MIGFIKRIKAAYSFYNLFQKSSLDHNTAIYQSLGLNKKYYSPISSKELHALHGPTRLENDLDTLVDDPLYTSLNQASQKSL